MSFCPILSDVINTGQSRSIILTGNINDLFFDDEKFVPIIPLLNRKYDLKFDKKNKGLTQIVYRLNAEIKIINGEDIEESWQKYCEFFFKSDEDKKKKPDPLWKLFESTKGAANATFALELLRQITVCVRQFPMRNNLLIIIEGADLLVPQCEISRLNLADRQRLAIVNDWFSDPDFINGHNSVVLLAESRSQLHDKIAKLPQLVEVQVMLPDAEQRKRFIDVWPTKPENMLLDLANMTAGLSLYALRQLLTQKTLTIKSVVDKIEAFLKSQLGEETVEFLRPSHTFEQVKGFSKIKKYLKEKLIPKFKKGENAPAGAAFAGPIGGGKTYLGLALSAELNIPVIVLTGLRSKWFGETDLLFERLRRVIQALYKVAIFVDEADTQTGKIESEGHDTEKRLTGKIQSMMSDDSLKGSVLWILMTARIHLLSPDIRRPGRVGDLIVPILDPEGSDLAEFFTWVFDSLPENECKDIAAQLAKSKPSAAYLAMLRNEIKSSNCKTVAEVQAILDDLLMSDIELTREYQKLYALLNCTRKSLMPDWAVKDIAGNIVQWRQRIKDLEALGIR